MRKFLAVVSAILFCSISLKGDVINGDLRWFEGRIPSQATIDQYHAKGIKCPDAKGFASNWSIVGKSGTVEFPKEENGNRFVRFSGDLSVVCVPRHYPKSGKYVIEFKAKGSGILYVSFICYSVEGKKVRSVPRESILKPLAIDITGKTWTRYLFVVDRKEEVTSVHPSFMPLKGANIDLDSVAVYTKADNDDMVAIAEGEANVRLQKAFLQGDLEEYPVDDAVKARIEALRKQEKVLKDFVAKNPQDQFAAKILKHTEEVSPYLLTDGVTTVNKDHLNRAAALCRVIEKITGSAVKAASAVAAPAAKSQADAKQEKKNDSGFSIAELKPGNRLCKENDDTFVTFSVRNNTGKAQSAVLEAILHSGIDEKKSVYKATLTFQPGRSPRKIMFNAGPASFGRGIEIRLTGTDGKLLASGTEYFQAQKEFMRAMLHGTSKYQNVQHRGAHEQTEFGIQNTNDQIYITDHLRVVKRKNADSDIKRLTEKEHYKLSFYQSRAISMIVGIEEVRKHPNFILYGENGQPMIDPIYGGIPNPFELASPSEMEPVRRKELLKGMDFLDVVPTHSFHFLVDFTNFDCLAYGAKCIGEYGNARHLEIVYLDDLPCLFPGYRLSGKYITDGMSREQMAKLNGDIARFWNSELRRWRPDAGSWCNGAHPESVRWYRSLGMWERTLGFGVDIDKGLDVSDDFIRELAGVYNSICLSEVQHLFNENSTIPQREYDYWLKQLLSQRDYTIQKYKGSVVFGYINVPCKLDIASEPEDLYWPTINYFQALTVATQHHHILYCMPPGLASMQPFDQFATRYGGLFWDRDVISMPADQAEKTVRIDSKANLFWKDFVYTRKYDDSEAMIIHLVRPYPLKKWDLKWKIPATVLKDVKATIKIPAGKKPVLVKAMRPYDFKEKKEVVEQLVDFKVNGSELTCTIPDFSYYNMLVVKYM